MTKEETNRYITEQMGEWQESVQCEGGEISDYYEGWICTCGAVGDWIDIDDRMNVHQTVPDRPDFFTWPGFGKLWNWASGEKWWDEFWDEIFEKADEEYMEHTGSLSRPQGRPINHSYFWQTYLVGIFKGHCLINPERFATAVYEFLKEREK
jgi:hypothetical protein